DIDEENPAPGEVVGDPAAERRTDGWRHHHCDAINGKRHAALGGRERVGEYRLFARLQASTSHALQNAKENQHAEVGGKPAEERADSKKRHATHVEALASDDRRKPPAERENDRIRNQVRREDPGAFILASRETAR